MAMASCPGPCPAHLVPDLLTRVVDGGDRPLVLRLGRAGPLRLRREEQEEQDEPEHEGAVQAPLLRWLRREHVAVSRLRPWRTPWPRPRGTAAPAPAPAPPLLQRRSQGQ